MFSPASTGSGESVLVIERSAEETLAVAVAESLVLFGSVVAELIEAVFEMLAPPVPFTMVGNVNGAGVASISVVAELIEAVFEMLAPPVPFTVPTIVIVADAPTASELNVTVRLFAEPPQIPPLVELHETKVRPDGRLSVTTTFEAAPIPLLVTVIV